MSSAASLADLLRQLGGISPRRIRAVPPPGTATEKDVLRFLEASDKRLYELVDGVLVEKIMGALESSLACDLIYLLKAFLVEHDLGFLTGPDGALRLMPGLVRIPDISFISWDQLPSKKRPTKPIPKLAPALAVEVLSEGNTKGEMERKVREYFLSGVAVIWLVDPRKREVRVYDRSGEMIVLDEDQTLDGGSVLPGLKLPVRQVFAGIPEPENGPSPRRRRRKQ